MRWTILFRMLLFLASLGAGPCEVMKLGADDAQSASDTASDELQCDQFDITCNHSLAVHVLLAGDEEYPAGLYTFAIIAPDGSDYFIDCVLVRPETGLECESGDLDVLGATIDALDPTTIDVAVKGAPPWCTVQVLYNDFEVGSALLEPAYDITYPNGEGCEPACYSGEDHLAVALW